jgi:cysteine-rich repeat protein
MAECGNGFVEGDEQCDDGNRVADDDCDNACLVPCGLDFAVITPAPTLDSDARGTHVAAGADGTIAMSTFVHEVITDMRGQQTVLDDVIVVRAHDPGGKLRFEHTVATPEGDVDQGGVVVTDDGDVVVAASLRSADSGKEILVRWLAASDGAEVWSSIYAGAAGEDDIATGLALAPDGDVVVAGRIRVADGDNDTWVRKLAAADGAEVWTTTHSGTFNGGFSVDVGGPVAVADSGQVYALMSEYVDFETKQSTLLAIPAGGGAPVWTYQPTLPGTGTAKNHIPISVVATGDGGAAFTIDRIVGGELTSHVFVIDAAGAEQWAMSTDDLAREQGSGWTLRGVAATDDGVAVAGRYLNDFESFDSVWGEVWVARFTLDGTLQCRVGYQQGGRGLLPPSLFPAAVGSGPAGGVFVTGELVDEGESAAWLGRFRPPMR